MTDISPPALEMRRGQTWVWTYLFQTEHGQFVAVNERGTSYEFSPAQWYELPLIVTHHPGEQLK